MFEYKPPQTPWLDIVFEDDDILVANKQAGLLSVPGRLAEHSDSLWSRLVEQYPEIQVVHRLDMDTSGLMLFAKHKEAERSLKKQFQYRLTHKIYYARVWGKLEQQQGEIDLPLIGDWPNRPKQKVCFETGKPSLTHFEVVKYESHPNNVWTTIVRLLPVTGRSHQLRVHMQSLGHPIVGDEFYADVAAYEFSERLALHAAELSFFHPQTLESQGIFVPCDFYIEASQMIFDYFTVASKLPDYKSLPQP